MKKPFLLPFVAAMAALASCTTREEIICEPGKLTVMATGFTEAELDSAIVMRYDAGASFSNVTDTATVRVARKGGDTLQLMVVPYAARTPVPYPNGYLEYGADYRLYIPKPGRWYDFSEIKFAGNTRQTVTHRKGDLKHYFCTNNVVSCKINGAVEHVQRADTDDAVYISK